MSANYQSLYRRFRPQRFSEVLGQDHVTRALRAAVASDSVGHAYLFSGPRGTVKTSTARILAKALNCENLQDGEPCLTCSSCVSIASGGSGEVEELDAASNSGVDAMRWLIQTVATAGTGRWKVYIIDEVHMLSTAASNALLKTLEEPPPHVIFILATTNPQKVLQTVVSRTQHFEFHLLDMVAVGEVVDDIANRTGVELNAATRQWVLRRGRGSARDTLSVLEQVLASGQVIPEVDASIELAVTSLLELDASATVVAVEDLLQTGNDPLWVVSEMLLRLKDQFLGNLSGQGGDYPLARITRAMETLGRLSVGVRDALDPGVVLEAVLVQLISDSSGGADLEQRVQRLEEALRQGASSPSPRSEPTRAPATTETRPAREDVARSSGNDLARLRGVIGRPSGRPAAGKPAETPSTVDQSSSAPQTLASRPAQPPKRPSTVDALTVFTTEPEQDLGLAGVGNASNASGKQDAADGVIGTDPEIVANQVDAVSTRDANSEDPSDHESKEEATGEPLPPSPRFAEPVDGDLDLASTDRLRSVIQAEWLERYLPTLNQRNIRTWIRDTRLTVLGAGEIGIVLDHETRRKKLEPYLDEIVATLRQLYGSSLRIRLLLESEAHDAAPASVEEMDPHQESALDPEEEEVSTTSVSTQRFSDDAIIANVTEVFPGARLIQGEL
ncbi:DNA polymerase III subunit gamma/tau [Ferrimicrobium acidiphilum]|uniref:DNA polymerase III subunit gamma/tau n=1 Tax=Ferrimicrobium acidiphilum TaxID=121039 RepID=UPI0023F105F7|nr:DNA polymerase III subunit gamma/tau [Ferrimicrobium acidiphilum]